MKPVQTEVPRVNEKAMKVKSLHEEMKRITVVRPRLETKTVRSFWDRLFGVGGTRIACVRTCK